MASISIEGDDFSLLVKQVQKFDKELGKALRKRITAEANEVRDDVRRAALAIPSGGSASLPIGAGSAKGLAKAIRAPRGGSAGLRAGIAGATETKVLANRPGRFNIRIRVSGSKFAARTGKPVTLPRYMEGLSKKSWRHPVFVKRADLPGPAGRWASQSTHPFLLPTASAHKAATQTAVKRALQDAVDATLTGRLKAR